jgi:methyl-accepting chemotaxis protein
MKNGLMTALKPFLVRTLWRALIGVGGISLLALAMACSGGDDDSEAAQREDFCDDLSTLRSGVDDLVTAVGTLDRSNIQEAINDVQDDVDAVRSSGQEIRSDNSEQIESAYNDLKSAVSAVGQGGSLSSNFSAIANSLTALVNSVSDAASEYNCN